MSERPQPNRRSFLSGKAAIDAIRDKVPEKEAELSPLEKPLETPAEMYLLEISRPAMACQFEVLLNPGEDPLDAERAVIGLDLLEKLEDKWSVYREHSEMSQINRDAANGPVLVSNSLFAIFQLGYRIFEWTEGAFDLTSGPLSRAWGFYRRAGRFPSADELAEAVSRVGSKYVKLDSNNQTIEYLRAGIEINLAAIGKGFAMDLCVEKFHEQGLKTFLFHGGQSSVVGRGSRIGIEKHSRGKWSEGWSIGITDPIWPDRRFVEVQLVNEAIGTSGTSRQFFYHQGKRYGHIFDPRNGWPCDKVYSATAIAPTAAEADALSTAFFVMGPEHVQRFCDKYPQYRAILVTPGKTRDTSDVVAINMPESKWRRVDEKA